MRPFTPLSFATLYLALPALLALNLSAERLELGLHLTGGPGQARVVAITPDLITPHGTLKIADLLAPRAEILAVTDGDSMLFQGPLSHPPQPDTLSVTDGVHTWSQAGGSSDPGAFAVGFNVSTGTLTVFYPLGPPEADRDLRVDYLTDYQPGETDRLGLVLLRESGGGPAEILADPGLDTGTGEIGLRVSSDLTDWQPVHLTPGMATPAGTVDVTDLVMHWFQELARTDGVSHTHAGRLDAPAADDSLLVTDGVHQWTGTDGSDAPTLFQVSHDPATRAIEITYLATPPEAGRIIAAGYDARVGDVPSAFFSLETAEAILEISGDNFFGDVPVSGNETRVLTLSNTGRVPLTVSGITWPPGFSADWESGVIAPGTSRDILITLNPDAVGFFGGEIVVHSNASDVSGETILAGVGHHPVETGVLAPVWGGWLGAISGLGELQVATFFIGRFEVTWGEWKEVRDWAAANGYDLADSGDGGFDSQPVHSVSWHDVVKWCNAKSEMNGLTPVYTVDGEPYRAGELIPDWDPAADGYRLPSEAEWEFAARGGSESGDHPYSGGEEIDVVAWHRYNHGDDVFEMDGFGGALPVGQLAPNELGLHDMTGNVWEWVWDQAPVLVAPPELDGRGGPFPSHWFDIARNHRRVRGGGWPVTPRFSELTMRDIHLHAANRTRSDGFRLARNFSHTLEVAGDPNFGFIQPGLEFTRSLFIRNPGPETITVTSVEWPEGFSGDWEGGTIPAGGEQEVSVTFRPTGPGEFFGHLKLVSTAADGDFLQPLFGLGSSLVTVWGGLLPDSSGVEEWSIPTFHLGQFEVTWGEWQFVRRWAVENGYDLELRGGGEAFDHPVHSVNWHDALKWCNALSEMNGLTPVYTVEGEPYRAGETIPDRSPAADGFRLPTEAEWEFAARGGIESQEFPFSGGEAIDDVAWHRGNSLNQFREGRTAPVGQKAPNELGLYDMTGNVWEWVWDEAGTVVEKSFRRIRGGGWPVTPRFSELSMRDISLLPGDRSRSDGFRIARNQAHTLEVTGELNFGLVEPGMETTRAILIRNHGAAPVTIESVEWPEGFTGDWEGGTIPPGGEQAVAVTFRPAAHGDHSGPLTLASDAPEGVFKQRLLGHGSNLITVWGGRLPEPSGLGELNVTTFGIGQFEVTWSEWQIVRQWAVENGYDLEERGNGDGLEHPVHSVSWHDTVKWCNALSEMNGLTPVYTVEGEPYRTGEIIPDRNPGADGYRLPVEAEWEFAARGGTESGGYPYSGGEAIDNVAWHRGNSLDPWGRGRTAPVGQKAPNELGLYDMTGNVWEWIWDQAPVLVAPPRLRQGINPGDPSHWFEIVRDHRRVRGGGWPVTPRFSELTTRDINLHAADRTRSDGFRLARNHRHPLEVSGDLNFGVIETGTEITWEIFIRNHGTESVAISSVEWPEGYTGDWEGGTLPAGGQQAVSVTFQPAAPGDHLGQLTLLSNTGEILFRQMLWGHGLGMAAVQGGTLPALSGLGELDVAEFQIGHFEVTWGEWQLVREWSVENGYDLAGHGDGAAFDHPVHSVSWHDAVKWCNALSEMNGLTPAYTVAGKPYRAGEIIPDWDPEADGYRLPTEAEWEFAARGGVESGGYPYSGGEEIDDVAWHRGNSLDPWGHGRTAPVGMKEPNELGLYDMTGNVWEWCWDETALFNDDSFRRVRGGGWPVTPLFSELSMRDISLHTTGRDRSDGFRLARNE